MIENKSIFALIPARGGSKGIRKKNLQKIDGLSLIARAIKIAQSIKYIDYCIVSTDDDEMAAEALKYGAIVPGLRPESLSEDQSKSIDVWKYTWLEIEQLYGRRFDISILLEPTSPMRTTDDIDECLTLLLQNAETKATVTVSKIPGSHTPEKTLCMTDNGLIRAYNPNIYQTIRQNIPAYYSKNGLCYAAKRDQIMQSIIIEKDCKPVITTREVVNIDTYFDLELAKWMMKKI